MKRKSLINRIVKEQVEIRTEDSTKAEIREFEEGLKGELDACRSVDNFIEVLGGYGFDRETATEMLFEILITD